MCQESAETMSASIRYCTTFIKGLNRKQLNRFSHYRNMPSSTVKVLLASDIALVTAVFFVVARPCQVRQGCSRLRTFAAGFSQDAEKLVQASDGGSSSPSSLRTEKSLQRQKDWEIDHAMVRARKLREERVQEYQQEQKVSALK